LNGKCLTTDVVYQATINYDGITQKYIGLTEGDFKTRYRNYTKSFNHIKYKHETELSKLVCSLKESNKTYNMNWSQGSRQKNFQGDEVRANEKKKTKIAKMTEK